MLILIPHPDKNKKKTIYRKSKLMNAPTIFHTALNYYIISLIRVQHTKIMMPIPFVLD